MFPDGEQRGAVSHRRRDALVLSRGRRYVSLTGDRDTLRILLPDSSRHRRSPRRGHAVRHRRRSGRRPAAAGRRGLSADLDGRQGGRLGGHAATRKGGGDQRPLLQRALPARRVGAGGAWRRGGASLACAGPSGCAQPSTAASGTRRAGTFTTSWTARRETIPPAVRISYWPFRCLIRFSMTTAGGRCSRWSTTRLLTPCGLRTLAPGHPDYRPKYYGDLRARDAAYHQGTVWPWLIGPFVDAWLRVYPVDRRAAGALLEAFSSHLSEAGVGSVSEIFDAEAPYTPRGAVSRRPGASPKSCAP